MSRMQDVANRWILYKGLAVTSDNLVRLPSLSFRIGRKKRIAYLFPLPRERGRVVNPLPMPRDGPQVVSTDDPRGTSRPPATSGVLDFTSDLGNLAICKFSTHALNVFCLYATVSSLSVS